MSDPIDEGSDTAQLFLDVAIRNASVVAPRLPFTGGCHYCGDPVERPALFCNNECSDDYDYLKKRQAQA
jgi:hypothetical protein